MVWDLEPGVFVETWGGGGGGGGGKHPNWAGVHSPYEMHYDYNSALPKLSMWPQGSEQRCMCAHTF